MRWVFSPEVAECLRPLSGLLEQASVRLPVAPTVEVGSGQVAAPVLENARLTLPAAWLSGGASPPSEPPGPAALDRWRRTACAVLEASVVAALPDSKGSPLWIVAGVALDVADRACPEMALATAELLRSPGSTPGSDPRCGVVVYRCLAADIDGSMSLARRFLAGDGPDPDTWLRVARFVLGPTLPALVGFPVDLPPEGDVPLELPPWSWARIAVPAHPRGGRIVVEGTGVLGGYWADAGSAFRTVAGALGEGARLIPTPGGPVGTWDNVSAGGWGQYFGVRGISWSFRADGRFEMVLAEAVAGPVSAAGEVEAGTSGWVPGRWAVAGASMIRLSRLDTTHLTQHAERGAPVPAVGMAQILQAMQEHPWSWEIRDGDLHLHGRIGGNRVEMRFRAASGA